MSSCTGYHTPIEDEFAGEAISDLPSDMGVRGTSFLSTQVKCSAQESRNLAQKPLFRSPFMSIPKTQKLLNTETNTQFGNTTQAPSPMSAVLTVSLDGYLDDKRMSYGSPPNSDLTMESFPVFSPVPSIRHDNDSSGTPPSDRRPANEEQPPAAPTAAATTTTSAGAMLTITMPSSVSSTSPTTAANTSITASPLAAAAAVAAATIHSNTLQPGGVQMRQHRRQSSINTVSWTDQGGDNSSMRPLSYTLDPSDVGSQSQSFFFRRASAIVRSNAMRFCCACCILTLFRSTLCLAAVNSSVTRRPTNRTHRPHR